MIDRRIASLALTLLIPLAGCVEPGYGYAEPQPAVYSEPYYSPGPDWGRPVYREAPPVYHYPPAYRVESPPVYRVEPPHYRQPEPPRYQRQPEPPPRVYAQPRVERPVERPVERIAPRPVERAPNPYGGAARCANGRYPPCPDTNAGGGK